MALIEHLPRVVRGRGPANGPDEEPGGVPPVPEAGRHDAFISYAREDQPFVADELCQALAERGKDLWVDLSDIPPAAAWRERVASGVEAAKAFVFVLSPDSVGSPECEQEWRHAVELHKKVVPVLHREVDQAELPDELREPNWILLRQGDDFAGGIDRLVGALELDLPWRDMHARLSARAREWVDAGRDRSFLLRGSDLRAAEDWLARQGEHRESPTRPQQEYIALSRKAATRRQRMVFGSVVA